MEGGIWLIIGILIMLIILGIIFSMLVSKKRGKHKPDYYVFFIMGIVWFPIGLAIGNNILWILGLIFAVLGLINKDKWKSNRRDWSKMDKKEKKIFLIAMIILALLVLTAFVIYFLTKAGYCIG